MLEAKDLSKQFGGLRAVADASLTVPEGCIVALIGPNGAGKTTLFAMIAGFIKPDSGRVLFRGEDITGLEPHRVCVRGIARTFQIVQPFGALSVCENIAVGAHLRLPRRKDALARAAEIGAQVGMAPLLDRPASSLTVAGRKRLELARALATAPTLLLLDEVMAGLNPTEIEEMIRVIKAIRASGVTILLIEHVMQAVMSLADHAYVLNQGRIIADGKPRAIADMPHVVEAYLGHGAAERMRARTAAGERA